jgi:hypothetical protein
LRSGIESGANFFGLSATGPTIVGSRALRPKELGT